MKVDYVIKNGHVIDPLNNIDQIKDIVICNNRIIDMKEEDIECEHIIDATDCIVTPGFIDFHTHLFYQGSGIGIRPDFMISQGTTAAVDAGTAGTVSFESFYQNVVVPSVVKIKSFLTVYSGGQLDSKLCEDFNPELFNIQRMERVIDKYKDNILGLKIRISKGVVPDDKAIIYLKKVINLAEEIDKKLGTKLRICVHTTNSPITAGEIAKCLRKGDIFCHCFQGMGNTIISENNNIEKEIIEARKRGVIFDAANGKGNFGIQVAKKAINKGFFPDIISSDLTIDKFNMPPYAKNLTIILSKYLSLGLDLVTVIKAVTSTPAELMGLKGIIGTLSNGAYADIVILKKKNLEIIHKDFNNEEFKSNIVLIPQMTMCNGEIQFCQNEFWN